MKRDIKWLNQWIEEYENEVIEERKDELKGIVRAHTHGQMSAIKRIKQKVDQLDEPETLSAYWIEQKSIDTHVDTLSGEVQMTFRLDDLENLLVPEPEEVDRAYKDGEPETVADVVADFYKSCERLQGVMSMEVEEWEE